LIRVWDWPVRVFHWSLALCVLIAYVTGESEQYSLLHQTLGYAAAGLLGFRLAWGVVGTRYAKFSQFVRRPQAVWAYLKSIREGQAQHHVGHNPVGGVAVLSLMGLVALTAFTGWLIAAGDASHWQEEMHEFMANTLMVVVGVHVLGVVLSSRLHHENLVAAMWTGWKKGPAHQGIARTWWGLGVLLLMAVLSFIASQLQL
jgi:cytochrome b